jgi:hypothetical protein
MRRVSTRLVAAAATVALALPLSLAFAAGPASALAGGGQTCTGFVGTADLSQPVPVATGTISGCNSNRDGTLTAVIDITGGVAPLSIFWETGKATSVGTVQVINIDFSGDGCPAGDIAATLDVEITGGPYEGTSGINTVCADISLFPTVTFTNLGDFHL